MMKTNAKRKNSAAKKLIPAAGMLALSASMLATSTYAWFTMNKTVTVTGMEVKTSVGSNLLISPDTTANTSLNAANTFVTDDSASIKAWLQPVSSNDGKANNFWYTLDADAAGKKFTSSNYIDYDDTTAGGLKTIATGDYSNEFSKAYGVTKTAVTGFGATTTPNDAAVGYVDYAFQLKATNSSNGQESIYLTDLTLEYGNDDDGDVDKAFRAAVFVEEYSGSAFAAGGTTSNAIYAPSSAAYFDNTPKAVGSADNGVTGSLQNVTITSSATALATLDAGETQYYKVVVRLWIEGEDTTCTNTTFAALKDTWKLDLRLDLGAASAGKVNGNDIVTVLTMTEDDT
jgi:hypothetical protein